MLPGLSSLMRSLSFVRICSDCVAVERILEERKIPGTHLCPCIGARGRGGRSIARCRLAGERMNTWTTAGNGTKGNKGGEIMFFDCGYLEEALGISDGAS